MKNYVVADTVVHAKATIKWMKLDDKRWTPLAYGATPSAKKILDVVLVLPISGVQLPHLTWVKDVILPRVTGHILDTKHQRLDPKELAEAEGPQLSTFAWDEQTLY